MILTINILILTTLFNSDLVVSFRLRDSSIEHMNDQIRDCESKVGEERVTLQLLSPVGKDVDTALEQLSTLEVSWVV